MSPRPIFDAYLTSSPAVTWNRNELIERAPGFFADGFVRPVYVASAGKDFPASLEGIDRFVEALEKARPDEHLWRHRRFPDERHYSLVHRSTYDGLRFLYADWQVPDEVAARADFSAYQEHFERLSGRFGYRIDIPMRTVIDLGNRLLREQRFADGIRVLGTNLELYPDQPESWWHVGDAHMLAGQPAEAVPFFREALARAEAREVPDLDDYRESLVGALKEQE